MQRESRLIPDPMHAEVKVQVQLPPEVQALINELRHDRQSIGVGGVVILGCTVLMTLKTLFGKRE